MTLRTAIVGCGAVAQRLYRQPVRKLQSRRLLEVSALVDPISDHASAMHTAFPDARVFSDLAEALETCTVDLVLILTPAHLHCGQTLLALSAGAHVLCEKPMASTTAECSQMNEAAASAGRVLAVGMVRRFFPAFAELRRILQAGQLGRLKSFEYREGHKFEWDVTTPAAFRPRSEGGTGVLFDIGPHALDVLEWMFGAIAVESYADDAMAGVEANAAMTLRAGGCAGSLRLAWDHPECNELRVHGELGEAVLRVDRFDQLALRIGSGEFRQSPITTSFAADSTKAARARISPRSYGDAIYCQLVQTARAIELGERPAVDGATAAHCVALLEQALAVASPSEMPWLSPPEQVAFRRLHWSGRV